MKVFASLTWVRALLQMGDVFHRRGRLIVASNKRAESSADSG